MKKFIRFSIFIFSFSGFLQANYASIGKQETSLKKPDVQMIEKNLFDFINKERTKRNLPLLEFSYDLSSLARKHSIDMAIHQKLSHVLSSGKQYIERLVEEGFYFIKIGENVAFSETYFAKIIHKDFMESSEHKENLLDPDFDQVGIGVIYKENTGYYITQDFRQSLDVIGKKEVKKEIQKKINDLRKTNFLPPFLSFNKADEFARDLSVRKARGQPIPPIPGSYGETHVFFITAASLDLAAPKLKITQDTNYEKCGIGVEFCRNKDHPGGAYFITLVLIPKDKYKEMSEEDRLDIVFKQINRIRQEKGLDLLKLDKDLSEDAWKISQSLTAGKEQVLVIPERFRRYEVISYNTESLYALPATLRKKIENLRLRTVEIGIVYETHKIFPKRTFWVTIILD